MNMTQSAVAFRAKKNLLGVCFCAVFIALMPPEAYCAYHHLLRLCFHHLFRSLIIEVQKERLSRFAVENDYHNLSWYIDDGESGLTLNRPEMNRLIKDIQDGEIQTVVATGYDRIARGYSIFYEWLRLLQKTDTQCVTLENGEREIRGEFTALNELLCKFSRK